MHNVSLQPTTIIDSGTSLIVGDPSTIQAMADAMGATQDWQGLYEAPCSNNLTTSFTLGGMLSNARD